MRTIWKFPLDFADKVEIQMPCFAAIIHVGVQHERLCLWAIIDIDQPLVTRRFRVIGTGHEYPDCLPEKYIGTVFQDVFVWHIFEVPENSIKSCKRYFVDVGSIPTPRS